MVVSSAQQNHKLQVNEKSRKRELMHIDLGCRFSQQHFSPSLDGGVAAGARTNMLLT
jgi:hypothetical protein